MKTTDFEGYFARLCDLEKPHAWQMELASRADCGDRLIRFPTGFGKTLGVLAVWAWHRLQKRDRNWPRRLVWCLPMRVLLEQTEHEVRAALQRLGVLWDEKGMQKGRAGVHLLTGGATSGQWQQYPEGDAVLIGTSDLLLSRALNRGYASPRARWPMEFGLLNQDALWIMDEGQLMDTGLATSAQLQVFRNQDREANKTLRPCSTWWMSATPQPDWLENSPDTKGLTAALRDRTHRLPAQDRTGRLWNEVNKPVEVVKFYHTTQLATDIAMRHADHGYGTCGPTLVILNTVERAVEVCQVLGSIPALSGTDIRLVHSRFRPYERAAWRGEFLHRFQHDSDRQAAPYRIIELSAALDACSMLQSVAPGDLARFEKTHPLLLARLHPGHPRHLLLRHELDELFDTSAELTGTDIDISRFIRADDERDIQVFWAEIEGARPPADLKPDHGELCHVPFLKAREWLCGPGTSINLKNAMHAWVWDWLNGEWREVKRRDIAACKTCTASAMSTSGADSATNWPLHCPCSACCNGTTRITRPCLAPGVTCRAPAARMSRPGMNPRLSSPQHPGQLNRKSWHLTTGSSTCWPTWSVPIMARFASPADQKAADTKLRIRGVCAGDILPAVQLAAADGDWHLLPAACMDLSPAALGLSPDTGKSWTERVLGLLNRFGPFTLAWLEAVLRAADQRATSQTLIDPLLEQCHGEPVISTSHIGAGTNA